MLNNQLIFPVNLPFLWTTTCRYWSWITKEKAQSPKQRGIFRIQAKGIGRLSKVLQTKESDKRVRILRGEDQIRYKIRLCFATGVMLVQRSLITQTYPVPTQDADVASAVIWGPGGDRAASKKCFGLPTPPLPCPQEGYLDLCQLFGWHKSKWVQWCMSSLSRQHRISAPPLPLINWCISWEG